MANNNGILVIVSLFLILFGECNTNNYTHPDQILENAKSTFGIETNKSNLLDHFPERIRNNNIFFEVSPPSSPPTYQCIAQFGYVYLNVVKSDYQNELAKLLNGKIMYKTNYSNSNIIINLLELRRNIFPVKKCNKWYANKLPVPYFESYDFGLGKKEKSKEVDGELYFNYSHTVPKDLKVYVIKAESGDFWKMSCNEKRPATLKQWQHGYSKGFAISEKENKLIFWSMVW